MARDIGALQFSGTDIGALQPLPPGSGIGPGTLTVGAMTCSGSAAFDSYRTTSYRFRNDDGSETTATWLAAENTGITQPSNTPKRLRFAIKTTGDMPAFQPQLEYRKVGDAAWTKVGN